MRKTKIAITLDERFIEDIDRLVSERVFQNRSQAIQEAVEEKLKRLKRTRLAKECFKLDIGTEKAMAEEGLTEDLSQWPEY
ncbi:MAG: CopG family transcriptional regulator [Planctomycetes bacterium]|nr:CopG family transcriptional regulator [Planctomycetota bacterium]